MHRKWVFGMWHIMHQVYFGNKVKDRIKVDKFTAVEDINIESVNSKYFFQIAQPKDHKGYIWILCMLSINCNRKKCTSYVAK